MRKTTPSFILFSMAITSELKKIITDALPPAVPTSLEVELEHPADPKHGDFATNIAFKLASVVGGNPRDLAEDLVKGLEERGLPEFVKSVEVAGPGFINFWLSSSYFFQEIRAILKEGEDYGYSGRGEGQQVLLEHTSPDPIKTIHIGHLRNNFLGMATARLLEKCGYSVVKDCIDNDRGTHVSRAMWGYLFFGRKSLALSKQDIAAFKVPDSRVKEIAQGLSWQDLLSNWEEDHQGWYKPKDLDLKPDHFDLRFYSLGNRAEELVPVVREQVREILRYWEDDHPEVRKLWEKIINWSHVGYQVTYRRIGSEFDHVWRESDIYKEGREIVEDGVERDVFRKLEDGAVLSDLSDYDLPDTILLKSDGTTLYHTLDLALTKRKREKFPSDLYIWCIGNDQILYLKQLFAMCTQLEIGSKEDFFHLNYGYVTLKGGEKMSSRTGTIVSADEILDSLHGEALALMESSRSVNSEALSESRKKEVAEAMALGALKYGLLKYNREKDTEFDLQESVTLEGDSGPYLQYSYARCRSVLAKSGQREFNFGKLENLDPEEERLLRTLWLYPEVLNFARTNFEVSHICNFLYDLAQKYNSFYNRCPILNADSSELKNLRLALTAATAQVMKNGLNLLGIEELERM